MLNIDFTDLDKLKQQFPGMDQKWNNIIKKQKTFLKDSKPSLKILSDSLFDQNILNEIAKFRDDNLGKFERVVVLGIGGSALGALFLYNSLQEYGQKGDAKIKMDVLDNIDPNLIESFEKNVDYKKTLFLVISKSGNTTETLAQFAYLREQVEAAGLSWTNHFVFVTNQEGGELRGIANKNQKLNTFSVSTGLSGRFSLFSVVSLLPAALAGIDVEDLLKGAKAEYENCFLEGEQNNAFKLAAFQYLFYKDGITDTVLFSYSSRLRQFAYWYRQLLAESLGKEKTINGEILNAGITPIIATGVTDQHSQLQLYLEGANDKFYIFLTEENFPEKRIFRKDTNLLGDTANLKNLTFGELVNAEMEGVYEALKERKRPVTKIGFSEINAFNVGRLAMMMQISVVFLAGLMNVNPFNQPGVELAKEITKKLLSDKL